MSAAHKNVKQKIQSSIEERVLEMIDKKMHTCMHIESYIDREVTEWY